MSNKSEEMQQFLDQNQYSSNSILRYEKIFGRGFVSSGGLETTKVGERKWNSFILYFKDYQARFIGRGKMESAVFQTRMKSKILSHFFYFLKVKGDYKF